MFINRIYRLSEYGDSLLLFEHKAKNWDLLIWFDSNCKPKECKGSIDIHLYCNREPKGGDILYNSTDGRLFEFHSYDTKSRDKETIIKGANRFIDSLSGSALERFLDMCDKLEIEYYKGNEAKVNEIKKDMNNLLETKF